MGRSPCCDKNGLKKGPWTQEEDQKLMHYIQIHGPGNWRTLPKNAGLQRCGKSCRLRWTNYLRPDIKRGRFSFEEEETIIQLHSILGNKWSAIAARLPGRTDNEIKNYWNTHIRKRLLRMGLDPVTHSPRLDFLDLSSILNSAQLNLSNLLGLQTLVNPELLRLVTLLASNQENPESLLNNQEILMNQNPAQEAPICTTPSSFPTTQLSSQAHMMQGNNGEFFQNFINMNCQNLQENLLTSGSSENLATVPNYGTSGPQQIRVNGSESSGLQSLNMGSNNNNSQDFSFDSVISTPISSSTPLNSSSTYINSGTEDERESYCSNMFKFEIPESFEFDDFM